MTVVRPPQPPLEVVERTAATVKSRRLAADADGDGEFKTVPDRPVCCRRRRVCRHNIRAEMGPPL